MSWYKIATQNNPEIGPGASIKTRLEEAVKAYLSNRPQTKPAYYINPRWTRDFDTNNQEHIEKELGKDYDKSFEVKKGNHPTFLTCRNEAAGLAKYLKDLGFKSRVVAGWYGHADRDYSTGKSPGLDDAWAPEGFGTSPQEHWWVEAEGYYIDLASSQFHPRNPSKQQSFILENKQDAVKNQDYLPVRRFPLGRAVPLPDGANKMVQQIASIKKFQTGNSSNRNDMYYLCEWISKYAEKYGLTEQQTSDIIASLKAEVDGDGFYFADVRKLSRIFGEAFEEIPEDKKLIRQDQEAKPFKQKAIKPNSMGTVKFSRDRIMLSTTIYPDLKERFEKLKQAIRNSWKLPNKLTFSAMETEHVNNYGVNLYTASCKMLMQGYPFDGPFELYFNNRLSAPEMDAIKEVFNAIKAAGFKTAFY